MNYKLAFISGATSGLGKILSCLLADKRIPLLLTGKDLAALLLLKKDLETRTAVTVIAADLSCPFDLERVSQEIQKQAPDLVINSAGLGFYGEALDLSSQEQLLTIDVNVKALTCLSIEAAKTLRMRSQEGTIVNISSMAAYFTYPSFAVYAASKRFVKDFSLSLDAETAQYGIRVLCSLPGRFSSPFQRKATHSQEQIDHINSWQMIPSLQVARLVLKQIEKKQTSKIIDFRYTLLYLVSRIVPDRWLRSILQKRTAALLKSYPDI